MLTTSLAKCLMGAHVMDAGAENDKSRDGYATTPTSPCPRRQEVRLDFMRAVYVIDSKGTLWFSHIKDMYVRPSYAADMHELPSRKTVENDDESRVPPASIREKSLHTFSLRLNSIKSGEAYRPVDATATRQPGTQEPAKTKSARWLVVSELKRVLRQARDAGASIEELFLHFDRPNRG